MASTKMSRPDDRVELVADQEGTARQTANSIGRRWPRMSIGTAPASARDALDMVRAGLGYLAAADPAQLATEEQAQVLRELERDEAVLTAARARSLAAFTAARGHRGDADYSPRAWLMHQTGITRGASAGHTAWARQAGGHR